MSEARNSPDPISAVVRLSGNPAAPFSEPWPLVTYDNDT